MRALKYFEPGRWCSAAWMHVGLDAFKGTRRDGQGLLEQSARGRCGCRGSEMLGEAWWEPLKVENS